MTLNQSQNAGKLNRGTEPPLDRTFLSAPQEWPTNAPAVLVAAAHPAHGCCDEESSEVGDRWDGLS